MGSSVEESKTKLIPVASAVGLPTTILFPVVSTLNVGSAVEFCTWKDMVELLGSLIKNSPVEDKLAAIELFVSKFNPKESFVPIVAAAPNELPLLQNILVDELAQDPALKLTAELNVDISVAASPKIIDDPLIVKLFCRVLLPEII